MPFILLEIAAHLLDGMVKGEKEAWGVFVTLILLAVLLFLLLFFFGGSQ